MNEKEIENNRDEVWKALMHALGNYVDFEVYVNNLPN